LLKLSSKGVKECELLIFISVRYLNSSSTLIRFQWVALQIDQILRLQLEEDIRNQLGRLPSDLERTYDDIFDTIRNSEGSKPDIAVRAFQWILFSFEPLSSESLVMFVGRNLENGATKHLDLDIYTVLDACCNLLVVDTSSSMCRFSHLSVQDYLEGHFYSTDTSTICAQAELASITIQCLLQTNHIHKSEDMLAQVPSLQYAAKFWHHHTRAAFKTSGDPCEKDAQTKQLVCDLFERQDKFNLWICLYDPDVLGNPILSAQNIPSPIYYSSLCGFCEPTKRLLEKGLDVNIPGGRHGRPLIAASWEGHYSLVEQLLEGGADVNSQGGNYGTALQAASVWGHEAVVSLLLEKGADVNCNCGHYGFALEAAAFGGHLSISEKLLQYGADVDAKGGDFGTALQAASSNGKEKLVKLLLDPGASVNIQNGRHGNALQAALWAGHIEIADLLRVHGALALATPVSLDWDRDFSFRVC
jgi:ankyrin repeat protein